MMFPKQGKFWGVFQCGMEEKDFQILIINKQSIYCTSTIITLKNQKCNIWHNKIELVLQNITLL